MLYSTPSVYLKQHLKNNGIFVGRLKAQLTISGFVSSSLLKLDFCDDFCDKNLAQGEKVLRLCGKIIKMEIFFFLGKRARIVW